MCLLYFLLLRLPCDMHVSRSSSNVPRLPPLFGKCTKTFASLLIFDTVRNPVRLLSKTTFGPPKVVQTCSVLMCFWHVDFHILWAYPYLLTLQVHKSVENTMFLDFSTFSCICIFFLLVLPLLWSSLFFAVSSHLCVSSVSILSEVWLLMWN